MFLLGQMLGWVEHIYFIDTLKKQQLEAADNSGVEVFMNSKSAENAPMQRTMHQMHHAAAFPPGNFDLCITFSCNTNNLPLDFSTQFVKR